MPYKGKNQLLKKQAGFMKYRYILIISNRAHFFNFQKVSALIGSKPIL